MEIFYKIFYWYKSITWRKVILCFFLYFPIHGYMKSIILTCSQASWKNCIYSMIMLLKMPLSLVYFSVSSSIIFSFWNIPDFSSHVVNINNVSPLKKTNSNQIQFKTQGDARAHARVCFIVYLIVEPKEKWIRSRNGWEQGIFL